MGSIYQTGRIWWIHYSKAGKDYWETAKSRKKSVAIELLKLREGDLANGKEPGITYEKVRFEDLKVVLRYLRRLGEIPETTDSLMVTNREGKYLGMLPLPALLTQEPGLTVSQAMNRAVEGILADTPAQEVANIFERRDFIPRRSSTARASCSAVSPSTTWWTSSATRLTTRSWVWPVSPKRRTSSPR